MAKSKPIPKEVDALLDRLGLDQTEKERWLDFPHPDLGGKTAREVIDSGNADAVVTLISNALSGIPS
ncbi:MAG: hypothetical protein WD898_00975 [Candidatus Paceibacterota bacterium]